ncbi:MAG TPA: hypothetical protein VEI04_06970 [Syntrophobacteria bacterium]|nr:hypothetical protein [Syntrophobacteria bacterium]
MVEALSERDIESVVTRATEVWDGRLPFQEKVQAAHALFARWGKGLHQNPRIRALLERLQREVETSWKTMADLEVVAACKRCDEEEGKSCCGRGFENKFDHYLLLMNLLLEVSLPEHRMRPDDCYFLTRTGCCLKVRLFLCVDFLCPVILSRLSHEALVRLQTVSGNELTAGFHAYDAIKRAIRENASAPDVCIQGGHGAPESGNVSCGGRRPPYGGP